MYEVALGITEEAYYKRTAVGISLPFFSRVFLAGTYPTVIFCNMNTSILQPSFHASRYVVPFMLSIFSVSPPLIYGTEYIVLFLL